jgi:hypothetical protein
MRRLVLGGLLLVVAIAPTALAKHERPTGVDVIRPSLRLVDRTPFIVGGRHFKAGERVKVVFSSRESRSLKVTANEEGSFTANFGEVRVERCYGFTVQAIGLLGSRAFLKLPAPACLPDATPSRSTD